MAQIEIFIEYVRNLNIAQSATWLNWKAIRYSWSPESFNTKQQARKFSNRNSTVWELLSFLMKAFFNSYANLAGVTMITICNLQETANRKYNCCYKTRRNHENILNKILSSDFWIAWIEGTLKFSTNRFPQLVERVQSSQKTSIYAVSYRSSPAREIRDLATTK